MDAFRTRVSDAFDQLGRWIFHHRWLVLALVLAVTLLCGWQLPKLRFDASTEGFLRDNNPARVAYDAFRERYGRDELIVVGANPPDVFDLHALEQLRSLHRDLETRVPHVQSVASLINARSTRGEGDELIVEGLLDHWPRTEADLAALKARVLASHYYRNLFISEDGRFTALMIKISPYVDSEPEDPLAGFDSIESGFGGSDSPTRAAPRRLSDAENLALVQAAEAVVADHNAPDFPLYLAGPPVVVETIKSAMRSDTVQFVVLTLLTIVAVLGALFRRVGGVVMPLLVVIVTLSVTLALMAVSGLPFKPPTQVLPSLLLAVGVADSIHVLSLFYLLVDKGESKEDAIAHSLGHSALPVVMTSVTTAGGMASFSFAQVAPVADLGLMASIGVGLALVCTLLLLPAMLAVAPLPRQRVSVDGGRLDRVLVGIADFAVDRARAIRWVSGVLILAAFAAASQLRFSHDPINWLPADNPSRVATALLDRELKGTVSMEMLIDTGRENGLQDPDTLKRLEGLSSALEGLSVDGIALGKSLSLVDIVKEINQALNDNAPAYYRIPDQRQAIAQELLLFESSGSDDLRALTDSLYQEGRLTMRGPWVDAVRYQGLLDSVEQTAHAYLGEHIRVSSTGIMVLLARTISATMISAAESYVLAFGVIGLLMILVIGDLRLGLLSMLPNVLPILVAMGVMWAAGLPLDMFTILIGSIAIGLAVDDTIHVLHQFRRYHQETGDVRQAIRKAFRTTGRALMITTLVLSMGFFVFMLATMHNLVRFGFLTGLTLVVALAADLLLVPALLAWITPRAAGRRVGLPALNTED